MTTDEVLVDVSQNWVLARPVRLRFTQGRGRNTDSVDWAPAVIAPCRLLSIFD